MLFTWLMLSALILLLLPRNFTNKFQFAFAHLFRWPLRIGRNVSLAARSPESPDTALDDRERRYENYIANLREQLSQEHQKVEALSGLRNRLPLQRATLMTAGVIKVSTDSLHAEIMVNRGRDDALRTGQFVIADNSIIGTVTEVSALNARIRLFTDPSSNIAVRLPGLADGRLLMQGAGGRAAKIKMVKKNVKVGTEVLADKKPGFLDSPMIIGRVARCERNPEPILWDITVEPVCNIDRLNNVVVIVMNPTQ
jgi:rod shape-determining protein MreC